MFNQSNGYSLADIAAATTGGNGNGGFGNWGDGWWIILLFLFANGNGGWGGNGTQSEISYGFDMNGLENGIRGIQNGLCDGFYAMNTGLLDTTAQLQSTMAQGFGGINTAIAGLDANSQRSFYEGTIADMQNHNSLMAQLTNMQADAAACCCETQRTLERNFADLSYRLATQDCATRQVISDSTRDIIDNQNAGVRSILEFLTQDKIAALQAENQSLKFAASQSNQNAFLLSQLAPKAIPAYLAPNPYTGTCYSFGYNAMNTCG